MHCIVIIIIATNRQTFSGRALVGTYWFYWLAPIASRIIRNVGIIVIVSWSLIWWSCDCDRWYDDDLDDDNDDNDIFLGLATIVNQIIRNALIPPNHCVIMVIIRTRVTTHLISWWLVCVSNKGISTIVSGDFCRPSIDYYSPHTTCLLYTSDAADE